MKRFCGTHLLLLMSLVFAACGTLKPPPKAGSAEAASVRDNSYSLLFQLLDEEKDVSKILIIKRETPELHELIKSISAATKVAVEKVGQFAKEDASLNLKKLDLPAGETRTRASISSATTKALLKESGAKFELSLLLTPAEALNYGRHLAAVAAENDVKPDRANYLRQLSGQLQDLHDRVVAMIAERRLRR